MTPRQFRAATAALGFASRADVAEFLNVGIRTIRGWLARRDIPEAVVMLLRLMIRLGLKPEDVK